MPNAVMKYRAARGDGWGYPRQFNASRARSKLRATCYPAQLPRRDGNPDDGPSAWVPRINDGARNIARTGPEFIPDVSCKGERGGATRADRRLDVKGTTRLGGFVSPLPLRGPRPDECSRYETITGAIDRQRPFV